MISLFDRIIVNRIQFQENDREVLVNCLVYQNNSAFETTLWIGFSDLNRLLAKIAQLNDDFREEDLFKRIPMGQQGNWYEFDSRRFGSSGFVLEDMSFQENVRQIRA